MRILLIAAAITFLSSTAYTMVDQPESEIVGKRPGEIIGCVHAAGGPDGCGTAESCSDCGALLTVLQSQDTDQIATGDCRMRTEAMPSGARN